LADRASEREKERTDKEPKKEKGEDLTRGGRDVVVGNKVYRNMGPNATGKNVGFDGFSNDRIKTGKQYVIEDPSGNLRRGTYLGHKSYTTGGRYEFKATDGKRFEIEFDNAYRYRAYEPLNKAFSADEKAEIPIK
jgi:hypothetical protein